MKDLEKQRFCIKFCFKLGKTFTETFQVLQQAYGEDCLSLAQCYEGYQRFKLGTRSIEDVSFPYKNHNLQKEISKLEHNSECNDAKSGLN